MPAQPGNLVQGGALSTSGSFATSARNTRYRVTFFDLPAELRNQIYDEIAEHDAPKQVLKAYYQKYRAPPATFAEVCQQTRQEYLPRLHRDLDLWLFDSYVKPDSTMRWLDIFGRSRVPLTRKICIWYDPFCCKIVLHGNKSEKQVTVRYLDWYGDPIENSEAVDAAAEAFVQSHLQPCGSDPYLTLEGLKKVIDFVRIRMANTKDERESGLQRR
ncbi:uncharacterized protein MYCFIDRAFT_199758 [Pseudocercospora fijiensis CIRAD86]|uniref:Uncharacterized protein n=1 Tax=Pseudocercospora fijiensis (strain CIRAD86) TaxID=383855 RepID=M2YXF5_PSEFD|nr:uncharacterized protein MYCFIDRAFT_197527 [Pseudocercospora fijiensis CIRAD86]XP_007930936.1 uncharacterized protein MYCFIDRAFT_199758 [Pseudocercospora fijiensis CIRAD86]EME78588.1 hypothetical protein MYCFIDRAFT_199758 [Pseudocercospora fijiensis CIRAD86]EME82395.1 hypothetical protein MYCFIDRAFT_197527 [Pseudocercospora fijiensis CIRAD86]